MDLSIIVNGVECVRADSVPPPQPTGNRAVIVIDRGWVAAGDVTEANGRIKLSRAVWPFKWTGGFDSLIADPAKHGSVRSFPNGFDLPAEAEIFRVPVHDIWGL